MSSLYPPQIKEAVKALCEVLKKYYPDIFNKKYNAAGFSDDNSTQTFQDRMEMGVYIELIKSGVTVNITNDEKMNDWISVKNEVPSNDDKVLVVNMGLTDIARYEEGKWFSLIFNYFMEDGSITHWMPLPEPPND